MKIYFIYSKKYKVEEYYHPEKSEWFDIEDGHPFILDDSMYCCIQFQLIPIEFQTNFQLISSSRKKMHRGD